jgi:hypothetical protein
MKLSLQTSSIIGSSVLLLCFMRRKIFSQILNRQKLKEFKVETKIFYNIRLMLKLATKS